MVIHQIWVSSDHVVVSFELKSILNSYVCHTFTKLFYLYLFIYLYCKLFYFIFLFVFICLSILSTISYYYIH